MAKVTLFLGHQMRTMVLQFQFSSKLTRRHSRDLWSTGRASLPWQGGEQATLKADQLDVEAPNMAM